MCLFIYCAGRRHGTGPGPSLPAPGWRSPLGRVLPEAFLEAVEEGNIFLRAIRSLFMLERWLGKAGGPSWMVPSPPIECWTWR